MSEKINTRSHIFTPKTRDTDPPEKTIEQHLIEYLATVDPLEDRAFKIILSDESIFKRLIEAVAGDVIKEKEAFVSFNAGIVFRVKGKEVQLDTVRQTKEAIYNVEGQGKFKKFSFQRQLYYWSVVFAYSLSKGKEYETLIPVISIVVYRNTYLNKVRRKAKLTGDLLSSYEDENLLQMFSLCTANWREEKNQWLRYFLALIDLGLGKDLAYYQEQEIDVTSNTFIVLYNSLLISCCDIHIKDLEEKGEITMAEAARTYLSSKDKERFLAEGMARGMAKGEIKGMAKGEIKALYQIMKMSPREIADKLGKEEAEINLVINNLRL